MGDTFGDISELTDKSRTRAHMRMILFAVAIADLLVVGAAITLAWRLRDTYDLWWRPIESSKALDITVGPWIALTWMSILVARGAYSHRKFGAGPEEFRNVVTATLFAAGAVGMYCFVANVQPSRGFVLLSFVLGLPMLLGERYVIRQVVHRARARGRLLHRVVAVGGPSGIHEVTSVLRRERYVGYEVVGACVPTDAVVDPDVLDVPLLGSVEDTRAACERIGADTVLVARGGYSSSADLRKIAWDLEGSDIELVVVPSLTDVAGPRIHMRPVAGLPLLHLEEASHTEAGGFAKRSFDILAASVLLVLLAPLMLVLAAIVKLEDGGPVFFRQPRVGRLSEGFNMIKFRSMRTDAEDLLSSIAHLNESDGVLFKVRNDPRVTPIGRFLRKYSLDELPQLFNVLRGDMSIVGPRPPLEREVVGYQAHVQRRLLVRPGMTGLWQVSGRSSLSWSESVRLDLYYVDNWSMTTDLVIMAKTVKAVLTSDGAY